MPETQAIQQLLQAGWQGIAVLFGIGFFRYIWPDVMKERDKQRAHEISRDEMYLKRLDALQSAYLEAMVNEHTACRDEREKASKLTLTALERMADNHRA